jgi:hypothetical protein
MDGTTRLLIVGGVVALVVYFGWPYFKGEMVSMGRQLSGDNSGVPPGYERFGEYPNRDGDRREGGRRLRLPPGVGNANGDPAGKRQDRYPLMERGEPMPRRWRDCRATSIWSDKVQCGPWQDGVPPRGGGRW